MLRPIWHVTARLTVFEIFAVKSRDFGALWGAPKRGADLSISTIMQNFTSIGCTSVEISVPGQKRNLKNTIKLKPSNSATLRMAGKNQICNL